MNDHWLGTIRQQPGPGLAKIAEAGIPPNIWPTTKAGSTGFNNPAKEGVHEMACMASAPSHRLQANDCREVGRKFVDIFKSQGSQIAEEAIRRIALLYVVEKAARRKSPEERAALHQRDAKPIFDDLAAWLDIQLNRISGKSELILLKKSIILARRFEL